MAKQPYIPLYIGDWEKDTNCLSPLAEFALLKLTFKLFNAEKRGVFIANYRLLSTLFKSDLATTTEIFNEIIFNNVLDIEVADGGLFIIKSRRMLREATISEIRANSGKSGGRGNKKQTKSKLKAKAKQIPDNDIDNDINNTNELFTNNGDFKKIFDRWLKYKKSRRETYNSDDSKQTALKKLIRFSGNDAAIAEQIIDDAIGNNYSGFFEPKNKNNSPRKDGEMVY